MPLTTRLGSVAALATLLMAASCSSTAPADEEILVLEVASETVTCQGEGVHRCLRVRAPSETEWRNFYDAIEGFTHEEGHRYVIEVARRRIVDPPADGSSFSYRLLRILAEESVDG
jgi:hypothetical protein